MAWLAIALFPVPVWLTLEKSRIAADVSRSLDEPNPLVQTQLRQY